MCTTTHVLQRDPPTLSTHISVSRHLGTWILFIGGHVDNKVKSNSAKTVKSYTRDTRCLNSVVVGFRQRKRVSWQVLGTRYTLWRHAISNTWQNRVWKINTPGKTATWGSDMMCMCYNTHTHTHTHTHNWGWFRITQLYCESPLHVKSNTKPSYQNKKNVETSTAIILILYPTIRTHSNLPCCHKHRGFARETSKTEFHDECIQQRYHCSWSHVPWNLLHLFCNRTSF